MATRSGAGARNFLLVARYTWPDGHTTDATLSRHRNLDLALERITLTANAWGRIFGGARLPIIWLVIDQRDYTEWHPGINLHGRKENEHWTQGRTYHRHIGSRGQRAGLDA